MRSHLFMAFVVASTGACNAALDSEAKRTPLGSTIPEVAGGTGSSTATATGTTATPPDPKPADSTNDAPPTLDGGDTVTVTAPQPTGFTVNWPPAADDRTAAAVLTYEVYVSTTDTISTLADALAKGTKVATVTGGATSTQLSGLVPDTLYYIVVVARDAAGNATLYKKSEAATQSPPDEAPPMIVTAALVVTNVGPQGFTVTWTAATDDLDAPANLVYDVYVSTTANIGTVNGALMNGTPAGTVTGGVTLDVAGLANGTTYHVTVLVSDASENQAGYAVTQATTTVPWAPVSMVCKNGKGKTNDGGTAVTPWDGWVSTTGALGNVTVQGNLVDVSGLNVTSWLEPTVQVRINAETRTVATVNSATSYTVSTPFSAAHANQASHASWPFDDLTTEDYQGSQGGVHYVGAERSNCNVTTLVDVSAQVPPDAAKNGAWTTVYQDQLTGMYFTNRLSTGSTWADALTLCSGLDGGTAGSGWYLPSHKEQAQLYIDGAGELSTTFGFLTQDYWSSTTSSVDATQARAHYFSTGPSGPAAKTGSLRVFCMKGPAAGTWPIKACRNGKGITNAEGTDALPSSDLNVDDWQNGATPFYTGADRSNCNETNFADVSATVVPDAAKHAAWTKTSRDMLTGVYFTNLLSAAASWGTALASCKGLDGGTGGSGWRLPTQKELVQLHVDGIARVPFTAVGLVTNPVWSSTTLALSPGQAYRVTLHNGNILSGGAGKAQSSQFLCVRQ